MAATTSSRGLAAGAAALTALAFTGLLVLPAPAVGQHGHEAHHSELGTVEFRSSCAAEVEADFNRAVGLLHHMMYDESRSAFRRVAERDAGCAMAHWGIAMTMVQPLWYPASADALRQGHAAVAKARELGPKTDRDRALVAAAEQLFGDPDGRAWWDRLRRWRDAMLEAHRTHPDDVETAAFYALSELAAGQPADDRLAYNGRAAEAALRIHERKPRHPGASHYMIHANDVTGRQGEALDIVRGYDAIAPEVPHALHMPTHIFVRLGDWPGVIEWNRKSADAALEYPVDGRVSVHYIHAIDYLVYAFLQRGEDERARAAIEEAASRDAMQDHFITAYHKAVIPARYALERRDWEQARALESRVPVYLDWDQFAWPEALTWFARGTGSARTGALDAAHRAETRMRELRERAEAAGQSDHARYIEIDRLVLAGWIAHGENRAADAIERMREAAALEGTIQKHPVTPGALLPPYEALGDLLTELGRPAEALSAYESSLGVWPGRYNSLLGAARAARAAGDVEKARRYYAALLEAVGDGDSNRTGVVEARRVVAARPG